MKRVYITAILTALAVLIAFSMYHPFWNNGQQVDVLKVGFIYDGDGSIPDTYNFAMAETVLKQRYPDRVVTVSRSNVLSDEVETPLREFVMKGCNLIFTNVDGPKVAEVAGEYPEVQFCQVSGRDNGLTRPANYHTFNGEIYEGRYISGIAAGMKLRSLLDQHIIDRDEALVGYVGTYPTPETISGFTAFLLGVRAAAPEAVMRVHYTYAPDSFSQEKASTRALIDEGCVIIAQHTPTIGPAVACEEAAATRTVYHIGYNQNMIDVAPTTSIVSTRVNWVPYVVGATEAVLNRQPIEKTVEGNVHGGNDISAGIERDWVQLLELNQHIAAYGTQKRLDSAIEGLRKGTVQVFSGNYIGVDPADPTDTYDLSKGFEENRDASAPSFHYILKDIITVD